MLTVCYSIITLITLNVLIERQIVSLNLKIKIQELKHIYNNNLLSRFLIQYLFNCSNCDIHS